jgi:peptidoglycan hydrolase CwlO-like protein
MEVRTSVLERTLRKTTFTSHIVSMFIAIVSAIGVGYGFYFNTNSTLNKHERQIEAIEKDVKTNTEILNEIQVNKAVTSSQINSLEKKVDKIDEKLDKLLLMQK